jgi:hypothetical protein
VRERNAAIPRALERVIQRLLEKEPEDRFQSAEELGVALERIGAGGRASWFQKKAEPTGVPLREPATRPKYPARHAAAAQIKAVWDEPDESGVIRAARAVRTRGWVEERERRLETIVAEVGAGRGVGTAAAVRAAVVDGAAVAARGPAVGGLVADGLMRRDAGPERGLPQVRSDVPWDVDEPWDEDENEDLDEAEELAAHSGGRGWVAAAVLAAVAAGVAAWLGGWFSRAA